MIFDDSIMTFFFLILSILGYLIAFITFAYLIYDHIKKDIELAEEVQDFYNDIGNLIFYYYKKTIMKKLYEGGDTRILEEYFESEMKHIRYKGRVKQKYEDLSKYLGLIDYKYANKTYYLSSIWKEGRQNSYINQNGTFYEFMIEPGRNNKDLNIKKKKDFYDSKLKEFNLVNEGTEKIIFFLIALKRYWETRFNKRNRAWKKLKSLNLNFNELKYDFEDLKQAEGFWAETHYEKRKALLKYFFVFISVFVSSISIILFTEIVSGNPFIFFDSVFELNYIYYILIILISIWGVSTAFIINDFISKWIRKKKFNKNKLIESIHSATTHKQLIKSLKQYKIKYILNKMEYELAKIAAKKAYDICIDIKTSLNDAKEAVNKYADFF